MPCRSGSNAKRRHRSISARLAAKGPRYVAHVNAANPDFHHDRHAHDGVGADRFMTRLDDGEDRRGVGCWRRHSFPLRLQPNLDLRCMTAINRAKRFMRRIVSIKRLARVWLRILNTNLRTRLSIAFSYASEEYPDRRTAQRDEPSNRNPKKRVVSGHPLSRDKRNPPIDSRH